MAQFLIELYQSDKVVGLVDVKNFEFHLSGPLFNNCCNKKKLMNYLISFLELNLTINLC